MNIAVDTLKASTRGAHWFKALTQDLRQLMVFQLRFGWLMVRLISKRYV